MSISISVKDYRGRVLTDAFTAENDMTWGELKQKISREAGINLETVVLKVFDKIPPDDMKLNIIKNMYEIRVQVFPKPALDAGTSAKPFTPARSTQDSATQAPPTQSPQSTDSNSFSYETLPRPIQEKIKENTKEARELMGKSMEDYWKNNTSDHEKTTIIEEAKESLAPSKRRNP